MARIERKRERQRARPSRPYNEGIDMLIRDRGVAVCLSVVLDTVSFAHTHTHTHAYRQRTNVKSRSRCVVSRAYITARARAACVMYSIGVTRAPKKDEMMVDGMRN